VKPGDWAARALRGVRAHGVDLVIVTGFVTTNLFARLVTLERIENGGDPLDAWFFVRQWVHGDPVSKGGMNHHFARFGMHWITWLVQQCFGSDPRFYYVPQLIASSGCVALAYVLGRLLHGRLCGVLTALWLMLLPLFHISSCQLRRGIFETMYGLAASCCLLVYLERKDARSERVWLVACAIVTFLGYLTEVSFLYLTPAMALAIWLSKRRWQEVALFGGVLFALFLVETAFYALLTKYSSRIGVLASPRGQLGLIEHDPGVPFSYLLERFTEARSPTKLVFYPFFVTGGVLAVRGRPGPKAVALAAFSFCFLITFVVRSIEPLRVFEDNHDRYLLLAMPLAIACTLVVLLELFERTSAKLRLERFVPRPEVVAAGGAVLLASLFAWLAADAWANQPSNDALAETDRTYALVNDALARGLPVIGDADRADAKAKARTMHWLYKGFVQDQFIVSDGQLKSFNYTRSLGVLDARHRYFPPNAEPALVQALDDADCAVRLRLSGTFVRVQPDDRRLPSRCGEQLARARAVQKSHQAVGASSPNE